MLILVTVIALQTLLVITVINVLMDFLHFQVAKVTTISMLFFAKITIFKFFTFQLAAVMKKELLVPPVMIYLENVLVDQTSLEIDAINVLQDFMDSQIVNVICFHNSLKKHPNHAL